MCIVGQVDLLSFLLLCLKRVTLVLSSSFFDYLMDKSLKWWLSNFMVQ